MKLADVRFSTRERALIASLDGEVDMSNAEELGTAVVESTPNDLLGVVLDLSGVDYLDSAGIHLIYSLRASLRNRGQDLRLVVPQRSPVNDTLRLAGIVRHLQIAEAVDDAVSGLSESEAGD